MLSPNRWARLCAGLVFALAVALLPTGAAHAAAPPSSGWNDWSCKPSERNPRPVVLVHGTLANKHVNWLGLAPYLKNRDFCVFSPDHGVLPGVPLFHGLGPIEESAGDLAVFVDRVLEATGAREVDPVGHSQGGLMPRYYLKHHPGAAGKVNELIAIAPSTNGTTLLGLTRLLDIFPGLDKALFLATPALGQQVVGSDFLTALNSDGYTVPGVSYTVIATRYDQIVTPWRSQFIDEPGVRNVLVQDLCALNLSEHAGVGLTDRVVFHEVANILDPSRSRPTTCLSVIG
ncbi:alpha/beta fold hydrolase [Streptomyces alkaliphilus]|uniref:Alpha/beta fold hydrolase n=1 Tax=Streptomyces alkaliphilus TaxID=1472722 RepID=A0A7W3Y285_9ACTN|nr:alpha/beta fold hydrolase [Streptomyces alkaliphilus]MBB0245171.1 alpha/beta fold hydrolase [Streptomyces alkaliphilus]